MKYLRLEAIQARTSCSPAHWRDVDAGAVRGERIGGGAGCWVRTSRTNMRRSPYTRSSRPPPLQVLWPLPLRSSRREAWSALQGCASLMGMGLAGCGHWGRCWAGIDRGVKFHNRFGILSLLPNFRPCRALRVDRGVQVVGAVDAAHWCMRTPAALFAISRGASVVAG